jgi:hypothetical protein
MDVQANSAAARIHFSSHGVCEKSSGGFYKPFLPGIFSIVAGLCIYLMVAVSEARFFLSGTSGIFHLVL